MRAQPSCAALTCLEEAGERSHVRCTSAAQQQVDEAMQPGHLPGNRARTKAQEERWVWVRVRRQSPAKLARQRQGHGERRAEVRCLLCSELALQTQGQTAAN